MEPGLASLKNKARYSPALNWKMSSSNNRIMITGMIQPTVG